MSNTDFPGQDDLVYRPPPGFVPPTAQQNTAAWAQAERDALQHPERYKEQPLDQPAPPPPDPQRPSPQPPGGAEGAVPPPNQPLGTPSPPVRAPGQFPGFDQPILPPSVYRPPSPNRGPAGWGKPWGPTEAAKKYPGVMSGPDMPTPRESYAAIGGAATAMRNYGSPAVAQHASIVAQFAATFSPLLDAISKGGFSRHYNAVQEQQLRGRLADLRIQQEQMLMHNDEMVRIHQQQMLAYGRLFELHRIGRIDDDELREELRDLNSRTGHKWLDAMLENKDIKGVEDMINWEDAQMRQADAGGTTLKKALGSEEDRQAASEWDDPTLGASTGIGLGGTASFPGRLPDASAGTQTASAAESDTGLGAPASDYDEGLKKRGYSPKEIAAIHQILNGDPPDAYTQAEKGGPLQKEAARKIAQGVMQANADIDQAAASDASPEDKLARIQSIDPDRAATIEGLHDYKLDPKDTAAKNRAHMARLTKKIYNDYDEGNYNLAHKFSDPNSTEAKVIGRTGNITQSALTVLEDLNKMDENSSIIGNKFKQYIAGNLTGSDERYKVLFDSLFDLDQHFQAVASFTGTPRVTTLMKQIENLGSTATPMQVRNVIMVNIRSAYQVINNYQQDWETATHRNTLVPGMNPKNYRVFRDLVRMNPYTGEMPSDAQPESLAVSRDPSEARKGLSKEQRYPPLPMHSIWQLNDDYKRLSASSDPEERQQAREILRRIGPIIGLTGHIAGVDDAERP